MKTNSIKHHTRILFIGLLLITFAMKSFSQATNYNCFIKNIIQTSPKNLSFEIWVENTGTNTLELEAFQGGINFNYNGLANGGIITGSFVPYSEDPSLFGLYSNNGNSNYTPDVWNINQTSKQIRMYAKISNGAIIPSSPGIKIGTFKMTNTVNFAPTTPNFTWSFAGGNGYTTQTIIACKINGSNLGSDITNPASQIISGNPVLGGASIPTLPEWGMIVMATMLLGFGIFYLKV